MPLKAVQKCSIYFFVVFISDKGPDSPSPEFKELLENEKSNFKLVNTAVSYLGGVPAMINPADMSNTIPNEKVREEIWDFFLFVFVFTMQCFYI